MTRFHTLILAAERAPTHCRESQKSLLLTGTFISSVPVQEILAVDSGSQCLRFRSCLCPHKDPGLPHLLLFTSNQRWSCNLQFTLDKLLRYHLESKAELNKFLKLLSSKTAKTLVMVFEGSSHCLCFIRPPGCVLVLYCGSWVCASSAFLCYSQVHLLCLRKQILHHIYPFPRALKSLFCLIVSSIVKCFFLLAQ